MTLKEMMTLMHSGAMAATITPPFQLKPSEEAFRNEPEGLYVAADRRDTPPDPWQRHIPEQRMPPSTSNQRTP